MTSQRSGSPDLTLSTPTETRHYVYGIIPTDDRAIFDVEGIDPANEVHTVVAGDLAVVTSGVSPERLQSLDRAAAVRALSAHQRVLETVMRDYPVLPVKFGTMLPDEDVLRALLGQGEGLMRETLAAYVGKEQREVVVLWDMGQVIQEIAAEGPISALRDQIAAQPAEETVDARVALGQMVHAAIQRRRAQIGDQVIAQLRDLADDVIINPTMDDSMVVNVALLLDQSRQDDLDQRLDELDALFGGKLQIRCVGPLPPYSFATLTVQALPFDAVDAARRQLGLAEEASAAAIKRAYRQLASQAHPDLNPSAEHAVADMEALTIAYDLLGALAKAQSPADDDGSHDWPCRLDRTTVERTLLLSVVRQEGAA
ncbi:GvpL/GvpF family gas vesicle protein [Oscillochloris sp. ZM17-4]|uniref:GvpL/GvpF family gas vesicle protein n=1 Tax=Oscillochloris sp. ZM17-4 TaxID=2866714 RepID=UPI001C72DFBF|nr:GvpL/GvpF family gas vesicle protein [Oscillochloris sp. ZM17-4]MBX0328863.1 GvpL/GvpF family gas vesicle protein [Oscillochloris sp. ZM17-4]